MLKVITYVDGKLTVICEDNSIIEHACEKPNFITSMSFYYEPTQKVAIEANGTIRGLTQSEQVNALAFIDSYAFTTASMAEERELRTHNVNVNGLYLGFYVKPESDFVAETEPIDALKFYWDFESKSWIEGYSIDPKGKLLSVGIMSVQGTIYIPKALIREDLCLACQTYDFASKSIIIDINIVKQQKCLSLHKAMNDELLSNVGDYKMVGAYEITSYTCQSQEAHLYMSNHEADTPFLDALLLARAVPNETKEVLVLKILEKEYQYKAFFGELLGKFHNRVKQVDSLTSIDEIKAVVW